MRKFFWVTIILFGLLALAAWSPWRNINIDVASLFGLSTPEQVSGLQVVSLAGNLEVSIDGNLEGTATETSPLILPKVTPGDRIIKLQRKSDLANAYITYSKLVKFTPGTDVILAYEIGPAAQFSGGHLIVASGIGNQADNVKLTLTSNVAGASVEINSVAVGSTPLLNFDVSTLSQQSIKITKAGYETQEFLLFPESQAERDKLRGLNLDVQVDLFLQPIQIDIN
jgi:hypothetical protein